MGCFKGAAIEMQEETLPFSPVPEPAISLTFCKYVESDSTVQKHIQKVEDFADVICERH